MTGTALVTGASGSLGEAFCRLLAADGLTVVGVGRDRSRLERLAASIPGLITRELDLTEPTAVERLRAEVPEADVLVAAAGAAEARPYLDRSPAAIHREITLNATVVAVLCHAYGAGMASRSRGRIITVASTAAGRPAPGIAAYAAAKAFVLGLSRALAAELRPRGIRVTCCVPGPIRSEFSERAGLGPRRGGLSADAVARRTLAANARGQSLVFPGIGSRLRWSAYQLAPDRLLALVAPGSPRESGR